jgi:Tfp pilus assembly protein PilP
MKLTTGILAVAMMTGAAWAQNSDANNHQTNAATGTSVQPTQPSKPTPGAPAPAVKPAVIPGAKTAATNKPANSAAAKPAVAPAKAAAKPSSNSAASQNNRLEAVKVLRNADDVQIEISSREAVTPKVDKLSSPARVVVELPATVMATAQNKIPVGSAGIKGVRIGMDGKTPPTTSVVVDLEHAIGYELMPGPGNKFVLTLHTAQVVAKNAPAQVPAKASTPAAKPQTAASKPSVAVVATTPKVAVATVPAPAAKGVKAAADAKVAAPKATTTTVAASKVASKPVATVTTKIPAAENPATVKKVEAPAPPKPEQKKWAMNGKRDPFFSPVVQQNSGSGCSTGKKCLEIGQINVRGVVKSETGFIAVVTNSLNKAYFLHENDPVFNGYVVKITGDSVVFQETMQDKLGKPFTREVVKRLVTPAV